MTQHLQSSSLLCFVSISLHCHIFTSAWTLRSPRSIKNMPQVLSSKVSPTSNVIPSTSSSSHNLLPLPDGMPSPTATTGGVSQHAGMFCYLCSPSSNIFWQRTKSTKSDELEKTPSSFRWSVKNWRETLLNVSNIASILCVIDCTVLPIVTLLFPLLGWASSASTSELLHEVGHGVARYFVLPVGTLTTALNFWSTNSSKDDALDRKTRWARFGLFALGLIGCVLVAIANSGDGHQHHQHGGDHQHHGDHHHVSMTLLFYLQNGMGHRVTNLVGCACLLTSNFLSKKLNALHNNNCCNREH